MADSEATANVIRDFVIPAYGRKENLCAALNRSFTSVRYWERMGRVPDSGDCWELMKDMAVRGIRPIPTLGQLSGKEAWHPSAPTRNGKKSRGAKFRCIPFGGRAGTAVPSMATPSAVGRRKLVGNRVG